MSDSREKGTERVCVCGAPLDAVTMAEVIARVDKAVKTRTSLAISVVNVAKVVSMRSDPLLRGSVLSGDLILADGMPLVWLSRMRGRPLPARVAGIDLMFEILRLASRNGLRVFLLGARRRTLERVIEIAGREYPGMIISGWQDGYFADAQQEVVARSIRDAQVDILLVAMSSPKKEIFMNRWSAFIEVPVVHGVGGSFDVMAGVTRRAPRWMQPLGLEWLYRLLQEPRRMWKRYLRTNLTFTCFAGRCVVCTREYAADGHCPWKPGVTG